MSLKVLKSKMLLTDERFETYEIKDINILFLLLNRLGRLGVGKSFRTKSSVHLGSFITTTGFHVLNRVEVCFYKVFNLNVLSFSRFLR